MIGTKTDTRPAISFEVFPPKKDGEFEAAFSVLDQLGALSPDFISVTYGAGGSNSKNTVEIASYIQNQLHIPALAHLTCVGNKASDILKIIEALKMHNVNKILALRGDRPRDMSDEQFNMREFEHASDMIRYLKDHTDMQIAGACYPEKHFEASSLEADLKNLKEKQDAGTDMLITQLFFDNEYFYTFREKADKNGINIPIHAGIMPITTAKQLGTTVSLSGSSVPKALADMIAKYADSPDDMRKAGIDFAICQIQDLLKTGVDGIHIYTMNKPKMAKEIMEAIR